ncbi:hypothetical protein PISMIDRAFT_15998 [Pisolithus microcarpus 441]|uniref:Uncharacterized protein n=1 Tax=Pisolithus microcarpus 441 TaxID=765257 RepID=A0A0C9XUU6_9AGAM|nr:hypothetical protein PISMIDRAFT_15998 [Pisolithus microcarpus 441]
MKFVQTSKALDAAIDRILAIFNRLVVSLGSLESVEKLQCWREAVKEIWRELESVRLIASRTDNVPQMLIGVDKFIHWRDDIGAPGVPFPDWHNSLFPTLDSIAGHPWLLTVEKRYDTTCLGWMVQLESPMAEPVLVATATTPPRQTPPLTTIEELSHADSVNKGKGKVMPEESDAIEKECTSRQEVDNDGESEVVEKDVVMDEEMSEPIRGRPRKRGRSQSESWPASTRRKSQSWTKGSGSKDGENMGEGMSAPSDPPMMPKPKYGRAQVTARTTPPPDPKACRTCVNCKVVCTWTVGNIPCNPCKKRMIGCTKGNVRCASTARTPKAPTRRQATQTPRNPSHPRKPAPLPAEDDTTVQPPQKKACISQGGQADQSGAGASSSSAPQRHVTLVVRPPPEAAPKHAVPPVIRAKLSAYIPLPAPPIPPSCAYSPPPELTPPRLSPVDATNILYHRRLDAIIQWQDLIFGQVDEIDRRVAQWEWRTWGLYQDRMQVLEGELADCRLAVGTLTREIETLRVSMHSAHPAQTAGPPPIDEDLLDLFEPSSSNAKNGEAEGSIAAQLQGLVFAATQSGEEMVVGGSQERSLNAQVAVESGSVPVGSESVAVSMGNDEQGGTAGCVDDH